MECKLKKLKVGIAGYGIVGKRRRQCIESHKYTELVAICDIVFSGEGEFEDGVRYYSGYKELLKEDLDILIVCLTNDMATEVTIKGMEAGYHVFCEKPPGRDLNDIVSVRKIEKKYPKLKLMYGFNHRYHDSVIEALKIVNSKKLGNIINLRGVYGKSRLVSFHQDNWRTKRSIAGGGILLDQGIHMVDLMRLFSGEYGEVKSFISNDFWGHDVEDNAYAIMQTEDGVIAMLNSSATQWKHRFRLEINLEKGSIELGGILSGSKSYGDETLKITYASMDDEMKLPREETTKYYDDNSWYSEINEFVDCIVGEKKVEFGSSKDAFETMKLVFKIYYSDKNWRNKFNIPNPDIHI